MAARLTDKQKKKIVADYLELGSYRAAGRKNGVESLQGNIQVSSYAFRISEGADASDGMACRFCHFLRT